MPMARCSVEASKLLRNPKIAPYISKAAAKADAAIERAAECYAVSRERNVAELARIAYANLDDFTRLVGEERVGFPERRKSASRVANEGGPHQRLESVAAVFKAPSASGAQLRSARPRS
jgi:hypothetical protein